MRHHQIQRTPSTRAQRTSRPLALWLAAGAALCAACHGSSSSVVFPPALSGLQPSEGSFRGGTEVRISGTNFLTYDGPRKVLVDGQEVTTVSEWTATQITFTTPPGVSCERVEVRVQFDDGDPTRTLLASTPFRYIGPGERASDLNVDDLPDVIVAAPLVGEGGSRTGKVFVFPGQVGGLLDSAASDATLELRGGATDDRFGSSVISADVNGDGTDDLIVCAKLADEGGAEAGSVYVFLGPLPASGVLDASDADILLTGAAPRDKFGSSIAAGDVDGDGTSDLLVGAPQATALPGTPGQRLNAGAAYLFRGGPTLASAGASTANARIQGAGQGDALGGAVSIGDMNGDGRGDLLLAARNASPYGPPRRVNAGAVYVFPGSAAPVSGSAAGAPVVYSGEATGDHFGFALVHGDVNGDGLQDLLVSAPLSNALGSATGRVYVFLGRNNLTSVVAEQAAVVYSGQQGNGGFGRDLAAGDYDDDGFCDMVVGAPRSSFGANRNGRCFVFFGAGLLTDELAHSADLILNGEAQDGEWFGSALRMIDADCDCRDDLISSATGNDAVGTDAGRVYTFRGEPVRLDRDALDDDITLTGDAVAGQFGSALATGQ